MVQMATASGHQITVTIHQPLPTSIHQLTTIYIVRMVPQDQTHLQARPEVCLEKFI